MADQTGDTSSSDSFPLLTDLFSVGMDLRHPSDDPPQGYDHEFVPLPDPKYECPICLVILKEPQQTQCGHRFCRMCITKWLRESEHRCPVDNEPIDDKLIFPDNFAKREILSMTVKCSNIKRGCNDLIVLKHLEKHLQICPKGYSPCPNNCSDMLLRCDIQDHLKNKCSKRIVLCKYCRASTQFDHMEDHFSTCPLVSVKCQFCGVELKRQDTTRHIGEECLEALIDCWFSKLGCQNKVKRADIPKHMQECIHIHMKMIGKGIEKIFDLLNLQMPDANLRQDPITFGILPQEMSAEMSGILVGAHGLSLYPPMSLAASDTQSLPVPVTVSAGVASEHNVTQSASGTFSMPSINMSRHLTDRTDEVNQSYHSGHRSNEDNQGTPSVTLEKSSISDMDFHSMKVQNVYQDESLALHDHQLVELQVKSEAQEKANRELRMKLKAFESVISEFEGRNCSGIYIWKIKNYNKLRTDAKLGDCPAVHSPPFYSSYHGYKLCIRANLNGVDTAKGTHLSIFVHFMQGEFDEILEWPFTGCINLTVMDQNTIFDQRHHIQETLISTPNIAAFQKPSSTRNHKGFGYMEFIPFSVLDRSTYLTNDTLIIKAHVKPSK